MFLVPNYMMYATPLTLVVLLLALFATPTLQQPNPIPKYLDEHCLNGGGHFLENSPYQLNLQTLLTSLETNSSSSSFFQTTIAETSPDSVYGRYICRHDLSLKTCSSCIKSATKQIVANCSNFKEAIVYFEQCTLLYLNSSTRLDPIDLASPFVVWCTPYNVTDPDEFYPVLQDTMNRVIKEAAYGPGSDGFGTEEGKVSKLKTLYSLAQCTPDRVGELCDRCLHKALLEVDKYYIDFLHVAFFYPNCQVRYSLLGTPFYDVIPSPPTVPSPPSPAPPVSKDPGVPQPQGNWAIRRMSNNVLNLGILMALLSALMLLGN